MCNAVCTQVRDNRVKMTRDEELGYLLSSILPSKDKPKDASLAQMQYVMTVGATFEERVTIGLCGRGLCSTGVS